MTTQAEHAQRFGELIHEQLVPYLTELADAELATCTNPDDSEFLQGLMSQYTSASAAEVGDFDELDIEDLYVMQVRDKVVQRTARYLAEHVMTVWFTTVSRCAKKRLLMADFGPAMLPIGSEGRFYKDYEEQVGLESTLKEVDVEVDEETFGPITTDIAFTQEQLLELMRRVRAALPGGQAVPTCALRHLQMDGILRPD